MLKQVDYLGHSISAEGQKPSEGKVKAISQAPAPTNLTQLRSFLGMVNYYGKFLKGLSLSRSLRRFAIASHMAQFTARIICLRMFSIVTHTIP